MTFLVDELIPDLSGHLAALGRIETFSGRELTRQHLLDLKPDVLLVRSTTMVKGALLAGTSVRFVGSATAGVDHVDIQWLSDNNIGFAYAPGSNAGAVVQYVLTVLDRFRPKRSLQLGIVGYGHVGSLLASSAEQLGMRVLVNDPPLHQAGALNREHTELSALLAQCDVLSLHVPLIVDGLFPTRHLINADAMKLMRQGALMINTSRGGVVDEDAIPETLEFVLDVFEDEPLLHNMSVERALLVTPHIAGHTLSAKRRGAEMVEAALRNVLTHSRESSGAPPMMAGRDLAEQRVVSVDSRRLESELQEQWLANPTPGTFDRCRREYVLV